MYTMAVPFIGFFHVVEKCSKRSGLGKDVSFDKIPNIIIKEAKKQACWVNGEKLLCSSFTQALY